MQLSREDLQCSICLYDFDLSSRFPQVLFPCGHNICVTCISLYQAQNKPCPFCNTPIRGSVKNTLFEKQLEFQISHFHTPQNSTEIKSGGVCKMHQKLADLFCKNCVDFICINCWTQSSHKGHDVADFDQAIQYIDSCVGNIQNDINTKMLKIRHLQTVKLQTGDQIDALVALRSSTKTLERLLQQVIQLNNRLSKSELKLKYEQETQNQTNKEVEQLIGQYEAMLEQSNQNTEQKLDLIQQYQKLEPNKLEQMDTAAIKLLVEQSGKDLLKFLTILEALNGDYIAFKTEHQQAVDVLKENINAQKENFQEEEEKKVEIQVKSANSNPVVLKDFQKIGNIIFEDANFSDKIVFESNLKQALSNKVG